MRGKMNLCKKSECLLYGNKRIGFRGDTENVSIMFVGESPGKFDEQMGSPFFEGSGPGALLIEQAAIAGLSEYNAYLANSAMCRIPKEEKDKEELKIKQINSILNNCRCHIEQVIQKTKPKVIVALGALAAQQLIKKKTLGDSRGTFIWSEEFDCYVLPTYSPGFCSMRPSSLSLLAADFCRVKTFLMNGGIVLDDAEIKIEDRESIQDILESARVVAVDTETQGLDYINPSNIMISYSISDDPKKAYQVFLHEEGAEAEKDFFINWERGKGKNKKWIQIPVRRCSNFKKKLDDLKTLLENSSIKKVMMNGNYDIHHILALFRNNQRPAPQINNYTVDVQLLGHMVNENIYARSSLELLRKSFTTLSTQYSDKFGNDFDKGDMLSVPKEDLTKYAAADACVTLNVAQGLAKALNKEPERDKQLFYFQNMVMPVTQKLILTMEENGVSTDMSALPGVREELQSQLYFLYTKIISTIPYSIKDKYVDKRSPEAPLTKLNMIKEMLYSKAGFNISRIRDKRTGKEIDSVDKKIRKELLSKRIGKKAIEFIDDFDNWRMIDTLLSKYITGIEKATRIDGKIHPSFSLATAVTGRSACLSGDTQIFVLDERFSVKVKDIKVGDWVWSFDDKLQPVPTQVKWQGKTGENKKVITVYYKTQGSRGSRHIKCTSDHQFRLRDGSYADAGDLKIGDRLMAIERTESYNKAYRRMWYTGYKGEIQEHQQVMIALGQDKSFCQRHIHHINKNPLDNRPSNLLFVSSGKEHCSFHPKTNDQKEQASRTLKKLYAEGKINLKVKWGEEHPCWKSLDKEWCEEVLWKNSGKPTVFRDKYNMDYTCTMKKLKSMGIDFKEIASWFDGEGELITEERLEKAKLCKSVGEAAKELRVGYYRAKELLDFDNNHTVVSIDTADAFEDVYDLTIEGPPNFIANGVCVHNCTNPNLQNIPKRGPIANVIRKLFVSSPGYSFVSADASQCLVPETELYTIDGVKTLEEVIKNRCPVLSMTGDYNFEFRDVINGWCTGKNEVFELSFDDNSKVIATSSHKFYDYYGVIKEVRDLKVGDRLLHVNLNYMAGNYPELSLGLQRSKGLGGHTNIRIHRVVARYLNNNRELGKKLVHHKDRNIDNWVRSNIEVCASNQEHIFNFHSGGENNPNYGNRKGKQRVCPVCGKLFYKPPSRDSEITCSRDCGNIMFPPPLRFLGRRRAAASNHKVIAIRSLGIRETYQIEVSINHNYVLANGLLSKNCELRWLSFLAQESVMLDVYNTGGDIHATTALAISGKTREELTLEEFKAARQSSKVVNFGFIYGAGWRTFQRVAKLDYGFDLSDEEAQRFRAVFFNTYPAIKRYHQKVIRECRQNGYVVSPLGRVRHLPEVKSLDDTTRMRAERQALNHAIQSVSSDTVLLSGLEIMKKVDLTECRPVLFIHDELTFEVKDELVPKYAEIIKHHMVKPPLAQFGITLNLPLGSDCKCGKNLAEMREYQADE
jgi:uracil-DNA glycosylase family 4